MAGRRENMLTQTSCEAFFSSLKGRRVAVCGLGRTHVPVVRQFLEHGAEVLACDKRERASLGETADELEQAGATLRLGEGYLDDLQVDLILRSPGMNPTLPPLEEARARGVRVTTEMELVLELSPAPVYGVTGSDGKTTTTSIVAGLLQAAGHTVHLGGNIGWPLLPGIERIRPEDIVVVELSSFMLMHMERSPQVSVVTNIAPNHLDWHTDMAEYIEAKRNIVRHQGPGDRAVLNADNAIAAGFAEGLKSRVFRFSRLGEVERGTYLGEDGVLYGRDGSESIPILPVKEIRLPGNHMIENFLAAFAAVWGVVPPAVMGAFARGFGGVPHRCELVRELDGVKWYNDSIGTSPTRTIAGLRAFGHGVILIAGGYDKHIPYDPLGPVAAETVSAAILMGDTAPAIQAAIRACSNLPIYRVKNMEEAVLTARRLAEPGEIVFLSPASASFDMYKDFEERGDNFKRLVMGLIEG